MTYLQCPHKSGVGVRSIENCHVFGDYIVKINLLLTFADEEGGGGGGQQNWSFFADVINV